MHNAETGDLDVDAQTLRTSNSSWRWSLSTLLLMMTTIAVWVAVFQFTRRVEQTRMDLVKLSRLSANLVITDPNAVAAVALPAEWANSSRWKIYVPATLPAYRLVLQGPIQSKPNTTLLISNDVTVLSQAQRVSIPITPGTHTIDYEYDLGRPNETVEKTFVKLDGKIVHEFDLPGPSVWQSSGSTSTSDTSDSSRSYPVSSTVKLMTQELRGRNPQNANYILQIRLEPESGPSQ